MLPPGKVRTDWLREYLEVYHPVDEHVPRLKRLPDSKIVPIGELFSEEERRTSITYNEGLLRFDTQNGLNVRLDGPFGARIVWAAADPVDSDGWTTPRIEMIARLLPHLRQYVRVRSALAEAGAVGASISELLETSRIGVIHLDRRGLIVEMNDRARILVARNDGLFEKDGELCAALPQDNDRLKALLKRALASPAGTGSSDSTLVRRMTSLYGLVVHVKPVAIREHGFHMLGVAAIVLIVDPARRARVDPELVQRVYGITPAQARIAVSLAEGRTLRQIAAETGRSYDSVRTHLKHMYIRMNITHPYDVIQTVLALSGLSGTES